MNVRIVGYESVLRLSQYMGDFHPEAQVKGSLGCNFTALIFNNSPDIRKALSLS